MSRGWAANSDWEGEFLLAGRLQKAGPDWSGLCEGCERRG